jgi:prepilin-type N-terminal cleavage/methylation domain-containing protein
MNMKFSNQKGFSLMELLMVTLIISIVAGIALMQLGSSKNQFQRQNVAQMLKSSIERARFDSVKRRVDILNRAKVVVSATSFTLTIDANANGVTTDTDDSVTTSLAGQGISITGSGMTFPVTVSFDRRGIATAVDGSSATVNPVFLVCNGTCSFATDTTSNSNIVLVTGTGTVNLLPGGSLIPSFATPAVTVVSPGDGVDEDVTIP